MFPGDNRPLSCGRLGRPSAQTDEFWTAPPVQNYFTSASLCTLTSPFALTSEK